MQDLHEFIYLLDQNGFTSQANELKTVLSLLDELIEDSKCTVKTYMKQQIDNNNFDAIFGLKALYEDAERLQQSANLIYVPPAQDATLTSIPTVDTPSAKRPRKTSPQTLFINNRAYELPKNTWRACVQVANDVLSAHAPGTFKAYAKMVNAEKLKTLFYATNQHKSDSASHYLPAVQLYCNTLLDGDGTQVRLQQMAQYFNVSIVLQLVTGEKIDMSQVVAPSTRIEVGATVQHANFGEGKCVDIKSDAKGEICTIQFNTESKSFLLQDGQNDHLTVTKNAAITIDVLPNGIYYCTSSVNQVNAQLKVQDGKLTLLAGSKISPTISPKASTHIQTARAKVTLNSQNIVQNDVGMPSVSTAASVAMGSSVNGWELWKTQSGVPILTFRKQV